MLTDRDYLCAIQRALANGKRSAVPVEDIAKELPGEPLRVVSAVVLGLVASGDVKKTMGMVRGGSDYVARFALSKRGTKLLLSQ